MYSVWEIQSHRLPSAPTTDCWYCAPFPEGTSDSSQIPLINHNTSFVIFLPLFSSTVLNWTTHHKSTPKPIPVCPWKRHACFHHNFTPSLFLEMSICHYIYLAITKFNIKLRSYYVSPRHPSNEWKCPRESPRPNSSDSTQPHMDHTFCQPQPSDDYFSDPCYLLVILTLSVEPKPIWLLPANWTESC